MWTRRNWVPDGPFHAPLPFCSSRNKHCMLSYCRETGQTSFVFGCYSKLIDLRKTCFWRISNFAQRYLELKELTKPFPPLETCLWKHFLQPDHSYTMGLWRMECSRFSLSVLNMRGVMRGQLQFNHSWMSWEHSRFLDTEGRGNIG